MQTINALPRLFRDVSAFGADAVRYVLFIVLSTLLLSAATARPALAEETAGVILVLTGKVEVEHGGNTLRAARMSKLYSGDTIMTGEDGQAQIRFADGTLLSLYRDTRFEVNDYHYDNGKNDRAQFSLMNGLMHTLTGQMDKRNYLLKTRLANLGVRGTEYSVQLGNVLNVSVDQGRVELVNAGGKISLGAGQSAIITGANAMPKPTIGGRISLPNGHGGHGGAGLGGGKAGGTAAPPPSGTQNFQRNSLPGGQQPPAGPPPAGPPPDGPPPDGPPPDGPPPDGPQQDGPPPAGPQHNGPPPQP